MGKSLSSRVSAVTVGSILLMLEPWCAVRAQQDINFDDVIKKMEETALEFVDVIEQAYQNRCNGAVLEDCYQGSYSSCISKLHDSECRPPSIGDIDYYTPECGDFESECGSKFDFSKSSVIVVGSAVDDEFNVVEPKAVETICYMRLLEDWLVENEAKNRAFWSGLGVGPRWTGFASNTGVYVGYPGRQWATCGLLDVRVRPWYTTGTTGPKNVILLVDVSESMANDDRIELMKAAASRVVGTLTYRDHVAIIPFGNSVSTDANDIMIGAGSANQGSLRAQVDSLSVLPGHAANYTAAFDEAFDVLLRSYAEDDEHTDCTCGIILLSDGNVTSDGSASAVNRILEQTKDAEAATGNKIAFFTISVTDADFEEGVHNFGKQLACESEIGVWSQMGSSDELDEALFGYANLFSSGLANDKEFVIWSEPFQTVGGVDAYITSVQAPVFDRSVDPPLLLGITLTSMSFAALDRVLGVFTGYVGTASTVNRFIAASKPKCPKLEISPCALRSFQLRGSKGRPICGNSTACETTADGSESLVQIDYETCPNFEEEDYPSDVWKNRENFGVDYVDRMCCLVDDIENTDYCPVPAGSSGGEGDEGSSNAGLIGGIVGAVLALVAVGILVWMKSGSTQTEIKNRAINENLDESGMKKEEAAVGTASK